MNPRIKSAKPMDDYQLLLEFTNGELGLYDCKPLLGFGVFTELQDIAYFKKVAVLDGTVSWPNGQDFCPDTLYLDSMVATLTLEYAPWTINVSITAKEYGLFWDENKNIKSSDYLEVTSAASLRIKSSFFYKDKRVEDKHRYNLMFINGKWKLKRLSHDKKITETPGENNILVILESPHRSEYDPQFKPIAPAMAETGTGKKFDKYFTSHLLPILESFGLILCRKQIYRICLVEPVPFQATLDKIHGKGVESSLRNKVWDALYQKCENDFKHRLQAYNPVIILNGCTSDGSGLAKLSSKKTLKDQVTESINSISFNNVNGLQKFEVSHPCCWNTLVYGKF